MECKENKEKFRAFPHCTAISVASMAVDDSGAKLFQIFFKKSKVKVVQSSSHWGCKRVKHGWGFFIPFFAMKLFKEMKMVQTQFSTNRIRI